MVNGWLNKLDGELYGIVFNPVKVDLSLKLDYLYKEKELLVNIL